MFHTKRISGNTNQRKKMGESICNFMMIKILEFLKNLLCFRNLGDSSLLTTLPR